MMFNRLIAVDVKLESDIRQDVRTEGKPPGGYEWWYFDAMDDEERYRIVVIFYEGNPFSRRYIQRLDSSSARPGEHPAVSISLYDRQEVLYCSFTEFPAGEGQFSTERPEIRTGGHTLMLEEGKTPVYRLNLKEKLPSGDALVGELQFSGPAAGPGLFRDREEGDAGEGEEGDAGGHTWNLVLPRARVEGNLRLMARTEPTRRITFEGTGYHDHNVGHEPMKEEFREWYWGRFHFEAGTLIFYAMDGRSPERHRAWLIAPDGSHIKERFDEVHLQEEQFSLFGLRTARKLTLNSENVHCTVQQVRLLDSGPFYQRFDSRAFLTIPEENVMQAQTGISEYIRPDRIYWKMFWPLVNMRIRYLEEGAHWVQRSKNLYRWTW